jgi:hydrogenase/urease accessory protein HupE
MRFLAGLLAAGCLCEAVPRAHAHDMPFSYVEVRVDDEGLSGTVAAHVVDLAFAIGLAHPESLLSPACAQRHAEELRAALGTRFSLVADAEKVEPRWGGGIDLVRDRKLLSIGWTAPRAAPPRTLALRGPLFTQESQHETFVTLYDHGLLLHQDVLASDAPTASYSLGSRQSLAEVVRTFVFEGIHHIFIGPDHILFVIGLLFLGGGLGRLLKIVTAFTVAHSVTLALAALELLRPPGRIVEPVIALSIVVVGVENLLAARQGRDVRVWIALGFGFVHGFGFAAVLREFGLPRQALGTSLFAFNLGVELGQAAIVLVVAPALALLRARRPRLAGPVVAVGSAIVIAAGGYWFLERVFGA